MLKLIHNRGLGKYVLAAAGIGIAVYFAFNAYPAGEWAGNKFLAFPGGPQLLGFIAAAVMGVLILLLFFYKEYMREDVQEYSRVSGDPSFYRAFKLFVWLVMALEFCSVAFRWYLLNWSILGFVLLAFGIVGIGLTYILGKVLHAQVNRPASVAARRLREEAGRQVFEDSLRYLPKLNIGQKRKVAGGDPTPIDEVRDVRGRQREQEEAAAAARQHAVDEETKKNEEFYRKMVDPVDFLDAQTTNPQTDRLSQQNGRQR